MKGKWVWQNPGADASGIQRAAVDWMIESLCHVRDRTNMYISQVTPEIMRNWLNGFSAAMGFFGVRAYGYSDEVLRRRGLHVTAMNPESQLGDRGWSPERIVEEMLAIEIEYWQEQRKDMEYKSDPLNPPEPPPPPN